MLNNLTTLFKSERGVYRNFLAFFIFFLTMFGIWLISYYYYCQPTPDQNSAERIFESLLPLFATWIGTVLAFYFGRQNFETAASEYKQIINQLNPDVLDDVKLKQIMITKKSMTVKEFEDIKDKPVKEILEFLIDNDKSRLPILDKQEPKYIIHKSTFLEALTQLKQDDKDVDKITLSKMLEIEKYKIRSESFLTINLNNILEKARQLLRDNADIKDIFVTDNGNKVVGWLTDTLIFRYLKSNSLT